MTFQREKQSVSASQLLQALADAEDIQLSQCTVTGLLDVNRFFDPAELAKNAFTLSEEYLLELLELLLNVFRLILFLVTSSHRCFSLKPQ